jgi:Kdo2-lipid IVA lauroyltransferase/acyltransferase
MPNAHPATDPSPTAMPLPLPLWMRLISHLPFGVLYALGALGSFLLRYVLRHRVAIATSNLRNSFPALSPPEVRSILNQYYRRLGEVVVECLKMPSLSAEEMSRRVKIPNLADMRAETDAGRSIILLAGHLGNWEWQLQGTVAQIGVPVDAAYKPLHLASADRALLQLRSRLGARMVAAKKLLRAVARHRNQVHAIALMADQIPMSSGSGRHWLTFLGQPTAFYPGPAEIAHATGYASFFAHMRRISRGQYELYFEPMTAAGERMEPEAFTARYARLLEASIRSDPANWMWSHRRWKLTPPAQMIATQAAAR